MPQLEFNSSSGRNQIKSKCPNCGYLILTRTCPSYAVPMPFCGSIPKGPLVCSGGIGQTAGALSAQVTWQEKPHTCEEEKKQKDLTVIPCAVQKQ